MITPNRPIGVDLRQFKHRKIFSQTSRELLINIIWFNIIYSIYRKGGRDKVEPQHILLCDNKLLFPFYRFICVACWYVRQTHYTVRINLLPKLISWFCLSFHRLTKSVFLFFVFLQVRIGFELTKQFVKRNGSGMNIRYISLSNS